MAPMEAHRPYTIIRTTWGQALGWTKCVGWALPHRKLLHMSSNVLWTQNFCVPSFTCTPTTLISLRSQHGLPHLASHPAAVARETARVLEFPGSQAVWPRPCFAAAPGAAAGAVHGAPDGTWMPSRCRAGSDTSPSDAETATSCQTS